MFHVEQPFMAYSSSVLKFFLQDKPRDPGHCEHLGVAYFLDCEQRGAQPNVVELALRLGFSSVQQMQQLMHQDPAYVEPITRLMSICEVMLVNECSSDGASGAKFLLKSLHQHTENFSVQVDPVTVNIHGIDADL